MLQFAVGWLFEHLPFAERTDNPGAGQLVALWDGMSQDAPRKDTGER